MSEIKVEYFLASIQNPGDKIIRNKLDGKTPETAETEAISRIASEHPVVWAIERHTTTIDIICNRRIRDEQTGAY